MLNSTSVSEMIIYECQKNKFTLSNTKIQKLLYIVFGTYLVVKQNILFMEEPLCLPRGPVFIESYNHYKNIGIPLFEDKPKNEIKDMPTSIIEKTVETYGNFTAASLSEWSHRPGSAWSEINDFTEKWGAPIPVSYIHKEFSLFVKVKT
ncbi:MAG: Panacea domain-containing protein [Treponemataceae bacterium]